MVAAVGGLPLVVEVGEDGADRSVTYFEFGGVGAGAGMPPEPNMDGDLNLTGYCAGSGVPWAELLELDCWDFVPASRLSHGARGLRLPVGSPYLDLRGYVALV